MKNYNTIKENLSEEKLITSKKLTELGYSRYDINQFLENGILKREKWGVYEFCAATEDRVVQKEKISIKSIGSYNFNKEAITFILKRQHSKAREICEQALIEYPNDTRIKLTLFATYVLEKQYENAKETLEDLYLTRLNDELLQNIHDYFKLLATLTTVEEDIIKDIKLKLKSNDDTIRRPKQGSYLDSVINFIENEDYKRACKYIGYCIKNDKENKKFHLTNVLYNHLIRDILTLKEKEMQSQTEEQEVVIVPTIDANDIIKQNLFQNALNSCNYARALELLESEHVENPIEVIKILLQKLSGIQLLINTQNPILIVEEEDVELVKENNIFVCEEESTKVIIEETINQSKKDDLVIQESSKKEMPIEELINITYLEYKKSLENEKFDEALKYLNRYEYLCNSNSSQRNINYHHIRIENCKKEYNENPERYLKKKTLSSQISELEKNRNFDEALIAIETYKSLGGFVEPRVLIIEARIAYETEDIIKLNSIIESLEGCEEPDYFSLKGKNCYRIHKYQDALEAYQQYNERRPNSSARTYKMIGECYSKLRKRGKAIKAFTKADEINKRNHIDIDISRRIEYEKMLSEGIIEEKMGLIFAKK